MLPHAAGSQPAAQSVRLSWCLRQVSARLLRDRGSARQGATFRGVQAEGWARVRSRGHLLAAHTCAPKSDADDFRVRPRSVALVPEESARAAPELSGWRVVGVRVSHHAGSRLSAGSVACTYVSIARLASYGVRATQVAGLATYLRAGSRCLHPELGSASARHRQVICSEEE